MNQLLCVDCADLGIERPAVMLVGVKEKTQIAHLYALCHPCAEITAKYCSEISASMEICGCKDGVFSLNI